jgi:hypothetical protein
VVTDTNRTTLVFRQSGATIALLIGISKSVMVSCSSGSWQAAHGAKAGQTCVGRTRIEIVVGDPINASIGSIMRARGCTRVCDSPPHQRDSRPMETRPRHG